MAEPLHTCSKCGRGGFTARGLATHRCWTTQPAAVIVPAAGAPRDDHTLASQLTEQYGRAMAGIIEIVKFGAMMIALRQKMSTCGDSATRGPRARGDGVQAWLKKHCPHIDRGTAYRFMRCAEAAREMASLRAGEDLQLILGAAVDALSGRELKLRKKLEKLLAGKSQRQLLLALTAGDDSARAPGGDNQLQKWLRDNHPNLAGSSLRDLPELVREQWRAHLAGAKLSPEQELEQRRQMAEQFWARWTRQTEETFLDGKSPLHWANCSQDTLKAAHELTRTMAETFAKALRG